jgi:hypothetical protein
MRTRRWYTRHCVITALWRVFKALDVESYGKALTDTLTGF